MEDIVFVAQRGTISEYRLRTNGLKIILAQMPDSNSPVVTLMIRYNVGSRNEAMGKQHCAAASHIDFQCFF